jgi:aryl-alcohol dehydrogenase-like predicted oxidoreductase
MAHRENWLDCPGDPMPAVAAALKDQNMIRRFGVSVYSVDYAIRALRRGEMDMIQIPFNVLDQRALAKGVFSLAEEKGKEVFIRSVYLQGLLLLGPAEIPESMSFSRAIIARFEDFSEGCMLSKKLLALGFVLQKAPGAFMVIGAEKADQVLENIRLYGQAQGSPLPEMDFLSCEDKQVINPALWPNEESVGRG